MQQKFILHPDGDIQVMRNLLSTLNDRDAAKAWEVTIKLHKEDRSAKQNRLQWMWHQEYALHHGMTKEKAYCRYKYKYCLPIMLRDPDNAQLVELWEQIRDNPVAKAALVKVIHTGDLNTAEMAEALTEYDRETAVNGLAFTDPADLRREAMTG